MPARDPLDPAELRRLALQLRDKATEMLLEADLYERTAKAKEALSSGSLRTAGQHQSAAAVSTRAASQARSGLNKHPDHPFVRAVLRQWPTVKAWAEARGHKYKAVHGWYTTGSGSRTIPEAVAQAIANEFPDVPATPETWANGIQRSRAPSR